jgi:predicted MFS family arabinose efflux permease
MAFTVDRVDDHERGEVLGSFTAFMDIGSGGGGFLIGYVADRAGFGWAFGVPALLCLCGLALLTVIARRQQTAPNELEAVSVEPL